MDIVVFKLGPRSFGLELVHVREVLRLGRVTPVPLTPPTLLGAMHVRGHVLPVADLAQLLGERASRPTMGATCLRVQRERHHLLFHVGRVEEVIELDVESLPPKPATQGSLVERIQPTVRGPLPLLALDPILATLEQQLEQQLAYLRPDPDQPPAAGAER
jgi:chemotaxis signal transduction protein